MYFLWVTGFLGPFALPFIRYLCDDERSKPRDSKRTGTASKPQLQATPKPSRFHEDEKKAQKTKERHPSCSRALDHASCNDALPTLEKHGAGQIDASPAP